MLILTRKLGESITIGDSIKITVLGIFGRQVRLGVEAPPSVIVHREEIYKRIQEENRQAAAGEPGGLSKVRSVIQENLPLPKEKEPPQPEINLKTDIQKPNQKRRQS